jgi:hypothetical protein
MLQMLELPKDQASWETKGDSPGRSLDARCYDPLCLLRRVAAWW